MCGQSGESNKISKMRLAIILGSNSRRSGGLYYSVSGLVKELNQTHQVRVFAHDDYFTEIDKHVWENIDMVSYKTVLLGEYRMSLNLVYLLLKFKPEFIYVQGIFTHYSFAHFIYNKMKPTKYVISPRGMLDIWALNYKKYKKLLFLGLFERAHLKKASFIHALNSAEKDTIKSQGFNSRIEVIPNGISIAEPTYNYNCNLLFLGRIHPKKGLLDLVDAMAILGRDYLIQKGVKLIIAGWSEVGHKDELLSEVKSKRLEDLVLFKGEVYGREKERLLDDSSIFILPSHSEGLPMSVLEAWSRGLLVIMTDECNLKYSFDCGAAIRIDHCPESIAQSLFNTLESSLEDKMRVRRNGWNLCLENYSWGEVANKHNKLINL